MEEENSDHNNAPPSPSKASALSQPKQKPKLIRVLTVLAYILSVSMAAILLSIYYIFIWTGENPSPLQNTEKCGGGLPNADGGPERYMSSILDDDAVSATMEETSVSG